MKHLGDITKIKGAEIAPVNVIIGGSPCQDLSVAGKRAGMSKECENSNCDYVTTGDTKLEKCPICGAWLRLTRSGLFMEQIRVIKEMRKADEDNGRTGENIRPRFMVWENVPGAFSSHKGADFAAVLQETVKIVCEKVPAVPVPQKGWPTAGCLYGMGDGGGPFSLAWRVFDAQFWGVPQRRRRIALVADFGGLTAPEILFERESVQGDIEASGAPRESSPADADRSAGTDDSAGGVLAFHLTQDPISGPVAPCLSSGNPVHGQCVCGVVQPVYSPIARALTASYDASPCVDRGQNIVVQPTAISFQERAGCARGGGKGILIQNDRTGALTSKVQMAVQPTPTSICIQGNCIDRADTAGCNGKGWKEEVSYTLNTIDRHAVCVLENHPQDSRVGISEDGIVQTLSGQMGTGGGNVPMILYQETIGSLCARDYKGVGSQYVSEDKLIVEENCNATTYWSGSDVTDTLTKNNSGGNQRMPDKQNFNCVINKSGNQYTVRRLTPLECERLQGFPDGWTDIAPWTDGKGKVHKDSDSARYMALGNSIALPPWVYVLKNLTLACGVDVTMGSLFDGIGGFPLIWEWLNGAGTCLWASEIEEFPIAVTRQHFADD